MARATDKTPLTREVDLELATDLFPEPEMTAVYPLEDDEGWALKKLSDSNNGDRFASLALRLLQLWSQIEDWEHLAQAGQSDPHAVAEQVGVGADDLVELAQWRTLSTGDIDAIREVRNQLAHGSHRVSEEQLAQAVERAERLTRAPK